MFKRFKILFLFVILIILGFVIYNNRVVIKNYFLEPEKIELPEEIKFDEIQKDVIEENIIEVDNDVNSESVETQGFASQDDILESTNSYISEINLAVPFTIQSPNQKWDEPYKEGCEEASILMVQAFLNNDDITINSALEDIQAMVDWQIENYEGHFDLSVGMIVEMVENFLNIETEVINLETIEDIKEIIKTGYPLILPTAGQKLGNPNFTGKGPLYHMLVVKGFKDNLIITNDPGTRKGENYVYDQDILWNAIADWDEENQNPNQNSKTGILLK